MNAHPAAGESKRPTENVGSTGPAALKWLPLPPSSNLPSILRDAGVTIGPHHVWDYTTALSQLCGIFNGTLARHKRLDHSAAFGEVWEQEVAGLMTKAKGWLKELEKVYPAGGAGMVQP
ncbi:MAG: hypothetical protein Q9213_001065 [Squamulea squamosa]